MISALWLREKELIFPDPFSQYYQSVRPLFFSYFILHSGHSNTTSILLVNALC
jgi:hypothetical protein